MKNFQVQAVLSKIETKVDGSIKMVYITSLEMSDKDTAVLMSFRNKEGYLLFADTGFQDDILEDLPKIEHTQKKSKSQRLRAVLYRIWERSDQTETFDNYYSRIMEKIINKFKMKLEG